MASAAEQRQAVADLTGLAGADLAAVWAQVKNLPPERVRDALMAVLPALGERYGSAAAALAAGWYEDARERASVPGRFRPILPSGPDRARWEALARWGVDPLFHESPDHDAALDRVTGGMNRTISDRHRKTITESSLQDPAAQGWRRVGRGDECPFCRLLISRGFVYSEKSVEFRSHDNCRCIAAPSFASNVTKVIGVPFEVSRRYSPNPVVRERQKVENRRRIREYLGG